MELAATIIWKPIARTPAHHTSPPLSHSSSPTHTAHSSTDSFTQLISPWIPTLSSRFAGLGNCKERGDDYVIQTTEVEIDQREKSQQQTSLVLENNT